MKRWFDTLAHPDIQEAMVFGAFNPRYGENVAVVVVPKKWKEGDAPGLNQEGLSAFLATRLTGVRMPRRFFVLAEIPRNASGKPDVKAIRNRYRYYHLEEVLASFQEVERAQVVVASGVGKEEQVVAHLWLRGDVQSFPHLQDLREERIAASVETLITQPLVESLSRGEMSPQVLSRETRLAYLFYLQQLLEGRLTIRIES